MIYNLLTPLTDCEPMINKLSAFTEVVKAGSYFTCTPPVEDTDIDLFVRYNKEVVQYLEDQGFDTRNCDEYSMMSFRKGRYNVITVEDISELRGIDLAAQLCTFLNLKDKSHRIAVFNTIQFGVVSDARSSELNT